MKIKDLTPLDEAAFLAATITPPGAMNVSSVNAPYRGISVVVDGWLDGSHLVFTVADDEDISSTINTGSGTELTISVNDDRGTTPTVGHWQVDMGSSNHKGDNWEISFEVSYNNNDTGKWVFSKGGSETEDTKNTG